MGRVRRATGPTVSFGICVHRVDLHRAPGRLRGEKGAAPRASAPMGTRFPDPEHYTDPEREVRARTEKSPALTGLVAGPLDGVSGERGQGLGSVSETHTTHT